MLQAKQKGRYDEIKNLLCRELPGRLMQFFISTGSVFKTCQATSDRWILVVGLSTGFFC
jgi:hypothetical protein